MRLVLRPRLALATHFHYPVFKNLTDLGRDKNISTSHPHSLLVLAYEGWERIPIWLSSDCIHSVLN